jgi:protein-tyrosine-phosphatase
MAPSAALEQVLDKDLTLALARSLSVPVPQSILVQGLDELDAAAAQLAYPLVVKPSRSMGANAGQRMQLAVSYARHARELRNQVEHALRFGQVLLQERFEGEGVGVELIADQGRVQYLFQHRRLHEVPLTGGGSSLRVSEPVVPALADASKRLIEALGWHGVAMVEFKYAPATGEFRLMEINGRFWGSLPLAVAAGADFPVMLHELLTTGRVAPRMPARQGIVCRQLSRDIDWLEHVLRRAAPPGLARLPGWRRVLLDTLLVLSPRHRFDVQSINDPWPGLVDLGRIVQRQADRVLSARRTRRRLKGAQRDAARGGPAQARVRQARSVLFLCHGNINRSAVAQLHAERRWGTRVQVASAGFHAVGDRPADPTMVQAADDAGLDLSNWRSRVVTQELLARADVVFVMELTHADRLEREFPAARDKVLLLGAASAVDARATEIADPYGRPPEAYAQALRRVVESVDSWLDVPPTRP